MRSSLSATPARASAPPPGAATSSVSLPGVMLCVMLGPLVNILDYNVVNVSVPKMMSGLGTDVLTIRWIITAFLISTAVVMPAIAWLGGCLGNKNLYMLGLVTFTVASGLCGLAPSVDILITLRILEGLGAGVLMPMSLVLMLGVYPPDKRGMGTALWGLGASMGSVIGLPLGGWCADALNWRAVFWVNLLPGALAVLCTWWFVPPSRRETHVPFDMPGFSTLAIALVSLLIALSQGQHFGWDSPFILELLAVFSLAFALFLIVEWHVATPLIDLRLYTDRTYLSGTIIALAMGVLFHGSTFLLVLFSQLLLDLSVQNTALALLPGSIAMVLVTPMVGWMSDRIDARWPMLFGLVIYIGCCILMLRADLRIGMLYVIWVYTLRGFALGFVYPPVFAVATSRLEMHRSRTASSLLNLCVTLGGAFSIALLSTLIEQRQVIHQARFTEEQLWTSVGTQQILHAFTLLAGRFGVDSSSAALHARGFLQSMISQEALVKALNDGFGAVLWVVFGCIVVVALGLQPPRHGR